MMPPCESHKMLWNKVEADIMLLGYIRDKPSCKVNTKMPLPDKPTAQNAQITPEPEFQQHEVPEFQMK